MRITVCSDDVGCLRLHPGTVVLPRTLGHTDLGGGTAGEGGERDTLGQVEEQEVGLAGEVPPAAHITEGVSWIHQLGGVAVVEGPDSDEAPEDDEGDEEAETEDVGAGPVFDGAGPGLVRVILLSLLLLHHLGTDFSWPDRSTQNKAIEVYHDLTSRCLPSPPP